MCFNPLRTRPFFVFAFLFFTPHLQKSITFLFFHVQSCVMAYFLRNKLHFVVMVLNIPCHILGSGKKILNVVKMMKKHICAISCGLGFYSFHCAPQMTCLFHSLGQYDHGDTKFV
ncbi:hypothetical protein GDO81_025797 [Engystomops pustulosus]|uniref:Secreted protein n=1 Tax=Engystomops pustulosus TaxID=76066 RepID=A0AAV6ZAG2_ENGPU|nr:hypothetical protein GDO81_025797 [Engystomops pustulosus]